MRSPAVSIIIPTKNRAELLRHTLASLSDQSLPDWEALIVDDGSTDDTAPLVARLAATDPRFRYLPREKEPPGAPACRNLGLARARSPFVLFLDSDDLLAPSALAQRLPPLLNDPRLDFVVANGQLFHHTPGDSPFYWNTFDAQDPLDRFLRADNVWCTNGPLWRRTSILRLGGWHEGLARWQDWELHTRALAQNFRCRVLPISDHFIRRADVARISSADGDAQGLLQRLHTLSVALHHFRTAPAFSLSRQALLTATAFNQFIALTHLPHTQRRTLAAWRTFSRIRGRHPSDLAFALCAQLSASLTPSSYLPLRLFRRYHHVPLPAPSVHCTARAITSLPTNPPAAQTLPHAHPVLAQ